MIDDPRLDIDLAVRKAWTEKLFDIGAVYTAIVNDTKGARPMKWKAEQLKTQKARIDETAMAEILEINRMYDELLSRTSGLYREVSNWMGPITADQQSQLNYYTTVQQSLSKRIDQLQSVHLPKWNKKLPKENRFNLD